MLLVALVLAISLGVGPAEAMPTPTPAPTPVATPSSLAAQNALLVSTTQTLTAIVAGYAVATPTPAFGSLAPTLTTVLGTPAPAPTTLAGSTPALTALPTLSGTAGPTAVPTSTPRPVPTATPAPTAVPAPTLIPIPTAESLLPPTLPGLTTGDGWSNEGVFLITAADDGSPAYYFIAHNSRHSILFSDLGHEQQLNPLWPVRNVGRDVVLHYPEADRVGLAQVGLVTPTLADGPSVAEDASVAQALPVAEDASVAEALPVAEAPGATDAAAVPAEAPVVAVAPAPTDAPVAVATDAAVATPADAPGASVQYTIQVGDNLTRLSARHGTTVQAILDANGLSNPNLVYLGRTITIPGPSTAPDQPLIAAPAPSPAVEAQQPLVADQPAAVSPTSPEPFTALSAPAAPETPEPLAALSVPQSPTPETPTPDVSGGVEPVADVPAAAEPMTYTVKRGESAMSISRQFGVDVEQLLAVNGVKDRNHVEAGQVLTIPGG